MFASHVWENQHLSPSPTIVMHAMVTGTSCVEEQLVILTRAIEDLNKYVQYQDAQIVKRPDRVEGMMYEKSSHAPRKHSQVQETVDRPSNQVKHAKDPSFF